MDLEDVKGCVIFTGIVVVYSFMILGCIEHRLQKIDRIIKRSEKDAKYIN